MENNNNHYSNNKEKSNIQSDRKLDQTEKTKELDNLKKFFPEITKTGVVEKGQFKIDRFYNVPFQVRVILGRKSISIRDIESCDVDSVIELDKEAGSIMIMTIYINGVPIFYGDTVISDDMFGVRITHLIEDKINPESYLQDLDYTPKTISSDSNFVNIVNNERFYDVNIDLRVEVGKTELTLKKIFECDIGTVIELNNRVEDPITVYGNNIPLFKGRIVIIDENFGVQITEIID